MNRALVLAGGGAKGSFQLGVVEALANRGIAFDVIAGVSTGALSAIMLAQGKGQLGLQAEVARLKALYLSLRGDGDVYKPRFLNATLSELALLFHSSIYNPAPIHEKLVRAISLPKLRFSGVSLCLGSVCLESGEYRTITQADANVVAFAMASASMPVFFPPVEINGAHWVDGGVRHITPLAAAFDALAALGGTGDEMHVVLCDPLPGFGTVTGSWSTGLPIAGRAVDLLTSEIVLQDLRTACAINDAVPAGKRYVTLFTYVPTIVYTDTLDFNPAAIRKAIAGGSAATPLTQPQLEAILGQTP